MNLGLNTAVVVFLGLLSLVYAADKKRLDEVCAEAPKTVTRVAVLENNAINIGNDVAEIKQRIEKGQEEMKTDLEKKHEDIKRELRESHLEILKLLRER